MPPVPSADSFSAADALDAAKLRTLSDGQHVAFLFNSVRVLRSATVATLRSTPTATRQPMEAGALMDSLRTFAVALLTPYAGTPRDGEHSTPYASGSDRAQLTACVVCDAIRLTAEADADTGARDGGLPFPPSYALAALRCVAEPFRLLCRAAESGLAGRDGLAKYCAHVVERAAVSRALLRLLPSCIASVAHSADARPAGERTRADVLSRAASTAADPGAEVEGLLQCFFSAVACAASGSASSVSASTQAEMARLLIDILSATNAITSEQLRPLLESAIAASASLKLIPSTSSVPTAASAHSPASQPQPARPGGAASTAAAVIATKVFLGHVDVFQPSLASFAMELVEQGVSKLAALGVLAAAEADGAGRETAPALERQEQQRRRRPALRDIALAMETLVAAMELNVNLCGQLVPQVLPYLSHELVEVRLLLLRGCMAAMASNAGALAAYPGVLHAVAQRFNDAKPTVRAEAVDLAARSFVAVVGRGWPLAAQEALWTALGPLVEQRLTDLHVAVRVQTVESYADALAAAPGLLSDIADRTAAAAAAAAAAVDAVAPSQANGLARSLGRRAADRNGRVRDCAVQRLCRLYRSHALCLRWIPDCVLSAVNADGGAALVERELESMLPLPTENAARLQGDRDGRAAALPSADASTAASATAAAASSAMALFDFEREAVCAESSYVDALVRLCGDLHEEQFATLCILMGKKPQLRLTITRLLELREELRVADAASASGQLLARNTQRLLAFLHGATRAQRGEWESIVAARDGTVGRALRAACAPTNTNWLLARERLLTALKGRLEPSVYRFLADSLVRQLALPVDSATHLAEMLQRVQRAFSPAALARQTAGDAMARAQETHALLRAVLLCVASSPSFLARCVVTASEAVVALVETAGRNTSSTGLTSPSEATTAVLLLLRIVHEWAVAPQNASDDAQLSRTSAPLTSALAQRLLAALIALCGGDEPAVHWCRRSADDANVAVAAVDTKTLSRLSTAAARCLIALCTRLDGDGGGGPGVFGGVAALQRNVEPLCARLHTLSAAAKASSIFSCDAPAPSLRRGKRTARSAAAAGTAAAAAAASTVCDAARAIAWLRTVECLAVNRASAALVRHEALVSSLDALLLAAVEDTSDRGERARASSAALLFPCSLAVAVADAAASALVHVALSHDAEERPRAVSAAISTLLRAYKLAVAHGGGVGTLGACCRRLLIDRQLCAALVQPTADIGQELAVAVVLSTEPEESVLVEVQSVLTKNILRDNTDMRYVALLLLTAIGCERRQPLQALRGCVVRVGDHLHGLQTTLGATLSDTAALRCYLEYTIPFLVLFMAHHSAYTPESTTNEFLAFQRVWHILFEELFRRSTQCASFVQELLRRIKASDDVLDRDSNATRVLCDLGSRVMLERLSQRQSSTDTQKRYPGAVLLPNFFAKTAQPNPQALLDTVYVSPSTFISANAAFRLPNAASAASGASEGSRSRSPSAGQSLARGSRPATTSAHHQLNEEENDAEDATDDADEEQHAADVTLKPSDAPRPGHPRTTSAPGVIAPARTDSPSPAGSSPSRSPSARAKYAHKRRRSTSAEAPNAPVPVADEQAELGSRSAVSDAAATEAAVEAVLGSMLRGLRRTEIAQLQWKAVKIRIESALPSATGDAAPALAASRAEAMAYARQRLRVWYDNAEP